MIFDKMTFQKMLVSIDGVDTPHDLWAYVVQGQDWNGWALPYFTKEQADRVLIAFNAQSNVSRIEYQMYRDEYLAFDFDSPHENPEVFIPEDIEVDGEIVHAYPIGAWGWTWDADPMPAMKQTIITRRFTNAGDLMAALRAAIETTSLYPHQIGIEGINRLRLIHSDSAYSIEIEHEDE